LGELYVYAWFTGTLIAGVVYTVGMRFAPHRAAAAA
jgi:cytosine/uracil/thiamine/allantoin permease